jgi:TolA-binding protein
MGTANGPLWALAGVIITALATVLVAKINGRSSQKAAADPIRLQAEQKAFESAALYWQKQIDGLNGDVARLEGKVDKLTAQGEANERRNKARIRQLENELIAHNIPVPEWEEVNAT